MNPCSRIIKRDFKLVTLLMAMALSALAIGQQPSPRTITPDPPPASPPPLTADNTVGPSPRNGLQRRVRVANFTPGWWTKGSPHWWTNRLPEWWPDVTAEWTNVPPSWWMEVPPRCWTNVPVSWWTNNPPNWWTTLPAHSWSNVPASWWSSLPRNWENRPFKIDGATFGRPQPR